MDEKGIERIAEGVCGLVNASGRSPRDFKRILVTHADVDHAGSLGSLAAASGAEVWAGEASAHYIARRVSPPHIRFPMILPVALMNFLQRPSIRPSPGPRSRDHLPGHGSVWRAERDARPREQ